MGTILKAEKFCVEFLKNEDFNKSVRSFEKDKFYGLKYISGEAKKLKDSLSYPFNPIYDGCTSFDDICKVVEDNCNGRLSGDSIVASQLKSLTPKTSIRTILVGIAELRRMILLKALAFARMMLTRSFLHIRKKL